MIDRWGVPLDGAPESVAAWNEAWEQFVHFRGDPLATLAPAIEADPSFALGAVFTSLYNVLAGAALDSAPVVDAARIARERAGSDRARAHAAALDAIVRGDFTAAGDRWDLIAREHGDFAAVRFAHDVFLHVGDNDRRVASSTAAVAAWSNDADRPGRDLIAGMHAFSLNEVQRYEEAERVGREALAADPTDLWARHALAHVYEEIDDTPAAVALLADTTDVWADQDLLATHVWWHLALRLLAAGDIGAVLDIYDRERAAATTAFRLCDLSSLLWRAELAGFDAGDRWDALADRWDAVSERHTCGFLDLHATLAFVRCPEHPGASRWFDGLAGRLAGRLGGDREVETEIETEIDAIFGETVVPLIGAFRALGRGDADGFATTIDELGDTTSRIGGSNAQRAIITLTRETTTT